MRFRVKAGKHVADGVTYKKGQVVDSHLDLVKLFPEKFEVVQGPRIESLSDDEDENEENAPSPTPPPPPKKPKKAKEKPVEKDEEAFEDD